MKSKIVGLILILSVLLTACNMVGLAHDSTFDSNYTNTDEKPENIYLSSEKVILKGLDPDEKRIDFYPVGRDEMLSLNYDGTTMIYDKYSNPLSVSMLICGDVLNIAYNAELGKVGAIVYPDTGFYQSGISKYSINKENNIFLLGDEIFQVDDKTRIFSYGREISLDQLINYDILTIQGEGSNIFSIRVDDGHGYLSLENEDAIIGGWIEIGQTVISQVSDNMLFTVPEGSYRVRLTNNGIEEYRDVVIKRNEVSYLNLKDIEAKDAGSAVVRFNINPSSALVYLDGNQIDSSYALRVTTGLHEITVSKEDYATVTEFFEVTGINQTVSVDLVKETQNDSPASSSKKEDAKMIIEAPKGAEVYEDNEYKGVIPVSYKKTPGTHVITLMKEGYLTTSFTVVVEDDEEDMTLSFVDLVEGQSVSPSPSSSVSPSPSSSASATPTQSPTNSPSPSPSVTPTPTVTPTTTPTVSPSPTATPSAVTVDTIVDDNSGETIIIEGAGIVPTSTPTSSDNLKIELVD